MTPRCIRLRRSAIRDFRRTNAHFRDVMSGVAQPRQDIWHQQLDEITRRHDHLVASVTHRHDKLLFSSLDRQDNQGLFLFGGLTTMMCALFSSTLFLYYKINENNAKVKKEIMEFIVNSNKKKSI